MRSLLLHRAALLSSLVLVTLGLTASAIAQFAPPVIYQTGAGPSGVALQEFNFNSNNIDIAVTNQLSNDVSVLIGNGDGTFQPAVNYNVGIAPVAVVPFCSITTGGFTNLAVANSGSNTVSVLVGNGDGTFQPEVEYALETGLSPQALVNAGDINGDGSCDLAVATASGGSNNNGTLTILLGNGDGTFQPAVNYDTLGVQPSAIVLGGTLGPSSITMANYSSNSVTVYTGDAQGVYTAVGDFPVGTGPKALILDQAGLTNFVTTDSGSNSITRLDSTGNGTYDHFVNFPAGGMPVSITQGVLTKSGVPSLVVANEADSTLSLYREKFNKPYLVKPVTFPTCTSPKAVVAALLRPQRAEDLVVVCSEGVGVMLNTQK